MDVGDKEVNFVGSRKWIGSMEVSFCLDHLIGVSNTCIEDRASVFFKIGGPKWPMEQKMVGHFLK